MNNATFAGRIGKTAELRNAAGSTVAGFSLAVDEYAKGERKTLWVDCSLWGTRAEKLAQYLVKGASVVVSGQVGIHTYEAASGPGSKLVLRVNEVTLIGGKPTEKEGGTADSAGSAKEELPF